MSSTPEKNVAKSPQVILYGTQTPYGYLYKPLSHLRQFAVLVAAFVACPAMAATAAIVIGDLSELADSLLVVPYIVILFSGYALWAARLQALAFETLGKSIFKTLFMLIVRRKKPASLQDVLPAREKLLEMAVKAQKAGRSFAGVSWFVGIVSGIFAMLIESDFGSLAMFLLVFVSCVGWGYVLAFLGRRGWLPVMEEA